MRPSSSTSSGPEGPGNKSLATWQDQFVHASNGGDPAVFKLVLVKEHTPLPFVYFSPDFTLNCMWYIMYHIYVFSSIFWACLQLDTFALEMCIRAHQAPSTLGSWLLYWSLLVTPHPTLSPANISLSRHFPSLPTPDWTCRTTDRLYDWPWASARGARWSLAQSSVVDVMKEKTNHNGMKNN